MSLRTFITNAALVGVAIAASTLFGEVAARLALNPADYLSVELAPDAVLGAVASATTAGGAFDAWGFRNREVPPSADIVAIGDSHTYGNTASMDDSWPAVLSRTSGRPVYNMGMGGYGPNQYFHLFTTKALALHPRTIIVGLYMGDDFENAFLITYGLEHWSYLRTLPPEKVDFDIWKDDHVAPTWHKQARVWLSRHSVIYQIIFHGPLLGTVQGEAQIRNAERLYDSATSLSVPEKNILEAFRPEHILRNLDQNSAGIREGMRITFRLLNDMNETCRKNGITFIVAVIPTKEMVFEEYLQRNSQMHLADTIHKLLTNERLARERTFDFLRDANVRYVDALPYLKRAVSEQLYARTAADMHPNRNGYRVIAQGIFEGMSSKQSPGQ